MNKKNQSSIKFTILLLLIICINSGCKISYDDISLGSHTDSIGEITGFPRDNYGYVIYDIEAEKIIKGHNINKEFIPASITKIFTALFAAEILGENYTFHTTLSYDGSISGNVLTGNIYLKGSGDPEFSIEGLQSIISGLKQKKVKEIKGNFYFDESDFTTRQMLDNDMPTDAYYNAGLSPLTFNSNIIYALQRRNPDGKIISADMIPALPAYSAHIYNENLPYPFLKYRFNEGKETWGLPDKNLWDSRQQLPVKQPGLFTAQIFQKLCEIQGIKVPAPKSGKIESGTKNISVFESSPLYAILKNMLFTSNNMTAELIYTVSSRSYSKENSSISRNSEPMEYFYSSGFTGLKWNNFRIANASGLTNLNKATPEQTTAVLLFIEKNNRENFNLEKILPISGWEGTMKGRLDQPEGAFRIYAKTGSIFYASGLAGVFYAKSGKKYIFTVYINDNAKRSEYDAKKVKTADDLNLGGLWSRKAASAIDDFMLKMITEL
jgi:D-alanyl-D-alanine carboxypeptidase/D-alanyl-D-alanine-endopeptidase (penicillin-binding protein 4)